MGNYIHRAAGRGKWGWSLPPPFPSCGLHTLPIPGTALLYSVSLCRCLFGFVIGGKGWRAFLFSPLGFEWIYSKLKRLETTSLCQLEPKLPPRLNVQDYNFHYPLPEWQWPSEQFCLSRRYKLCLFDFLRGQRSGSSWQGGNCQK